MRSNPLRMSALIVYASPDSRLSSSHGNSRIFQSLPRHLRRRAASHNPRRVPNRMRNKAAAEVHNLSRSLISIADSERRLTQVIKRSRSTGRKQSYGPEEICGERAGLSTYSNGSVSRPKLCRLKLTSVLGDKSWLSTHIWHAKRFHMTNLWSYRLPLTPTLKSFRPAYRASRRKAIVHDTSYFGIIELQGSRAKLLEVLSRITGGGRFAGTK